MRFKVFFSFAVLMAAVFLNYEVSAETIHLNDGRIVNERIREKNARYILTVDNKKRVRKYYHEEIDFIEEDAQESINDNINTEALSYEGIPPEKTELINTFINVSGVRHNMKQNIDQVISRAPEEQRDDLIELFNVDEIIQRLVPLYDKYYADEDLIKLIEFYESPAGQKFLEVTPEIMRETVGVSLQYIKEKAAP